MIWLRRIAQKRIKGIEGGGGGILEAPALRDPT